MVKTKLEELNLLDKFLFDEAMEDKDTYQTVVSILLENEVELLEKNEAEKEHWESDKKKLLLSGEAGCVVALQAKSEAFASHWILWNI